VISKPALSANGLASTFGQAYSGGILQPASIWQRDVGLDQHNLK